MFICAPPIVIVPVLDVDCATRFPLGSVMFTIVAFNSVSEELKFTSMLSSCSSSAELFTDICTDGYCCQ